MQHLSFRRRATDKYETVLGALLLSIVFVAAMAANDSLLPPNDTAMLRQFCTECHGNGSAEGSINIDRMTANPDLGRGFKDWEKVSALLRQGKMPPQDATQPSSLERETTAAAIERALAAYIRRHAGDPGEILLRRLTSAEFDYTVKDLTGLELNLGRRFVSDAVGGEGFTNVGGAQFIQDSTLEQYLEAAKAVAQHAVIGTRPLTFFEHSGETGRELAAITRIQEIYRRTGFRTAAGEGAKPFGLDLYPRAMFVAWQYRHRMTLGDENDTLENLSGKEKLSARLCQHLWQVLNGPAQSFPLSLIVEQWQALPGPATATPTEIRAACEQIANELRQWQSVLAAAAGDEEEAAVLTETEVQIGPRHALEADLNWEDGAKFADFELSVTTASNRPAKGALVVWQKPRLRFVRGENRMREMMPLAAVISPDTVRELKMGRHVAGVQIGEDDFVLTGESKGLVRILVPDGMIAARLFVDVELDTKLGADAIVRCRISDGAVASETAAEVGDTSTLLGNPASPFAEQWRNGVGEFARLLPEVSHREPTPSDRDPIPPPFDNAYNMPERNHFHTAIKYHRDDHFLMTHVLDDATRVELDQAWTDLLTSFEYHDANLTFACKKFGVDLMEMSIGQLEPADVQQFPAEVREFIERLCDEYQRMRKASQVAQPLRVEDAVLFAQRAWRRPLKNDEKNRLKEFYTTIRRELGLDHAEAVRTTLVRILVAPAFLYRAETFESSQFASPVDNVANSGSPSRTAQGGSEAAPISDWQLASRLSYLLWSSLPDDELLRVAAAGKLQHEDELERQVRRMLRDQKSERFAGEFFGQWLGFYRFDEYRGIDSKRFPEFDDALKSAMYGEAITFFTHIIRANRPVSEILFADYTFLNARLAQHYSVDDLRLADEQYLRIVNLSDQHRGGLLGMGAVLVTTSAPLRTSAVKRGDWMLRRVIGTPVPPPPADAGSIAADDAGTDGLTVRKRLEAHRTDQACVQCHSRIDPLGFALENFDPLGRWRDQYRDGQPIDASGTLLDNVSIEGVDGLRRYLTTQQRQINRHLCSKLLGYALGRSELASDRPLIVEMLADEERGGGFADLVVRIVKSKQFRYRRL